MATRSIIDLTQVLSSETPFFPGEVGVRLAVLETAGGVHPSGRRSLNVSRLDTSIHCGTHMDAPFHFLSEGLTIDQIDLEACMGPCTLVDLRSLREREVISRSHLAASEMSIRKTRRVVIHTGWSSNWTESKYFLDFPVISGDAAEFLVSLGILLVGVDTPSVDNPPFPAHLALLGNSVLIVENLTNLDQIPSAEFYFSALPLKIAGRDGSPVRAFAQTIP